MVRRRSTVRVRQRALVRGKSPEKGDFCCPTQHHRAPPHYRREGYSARCAAAKPLQIDLLPGTSEHLPKREGVRSRVARRCPQNGLDKRHVARTRARGASRASLGIGFGDAPLAAARLWSVSPVNGRKAPRSISDGLARRQPSGARLALACVFAGTSHRVPAS